MDTVEKQLRKSLEAIPLSQILTKIKRIYDIDQLDQWINDTIAAK